MTRPRYTLLTGRARVGSVVLGALAVLVVGLLAWPYTVDDAFIVGRYARNLVAGLGYGINPHQPSDGVTGPLWLLPEMIAAAFGRDPIAAAKGIGLGCSVLAAIAALRALRARALGRRATCAAALLLACSPSLPTWGVAGLETGAATLATTLATLAAIARPRPRAPTLGVSCALLAWLRPELAPACAVLLFAVFLRDRVAAARALGLALAGVVSIAGFRLWMFGHLLPSSVNAKAGSLAHGLAYTGNAIVLATTLVGVALAIYAARSGGQSERTLFAVLVAHVCGIALAGGDWMPGYRLLVPVLPTYAMLAALGAARLSLRRLRFAWLALALACSLPALDLAIRVPELRASAASRERARTLAEYLRARAARVALVDVGYLGYESGVELIDLGGLTDERIAALPGGHLDKHIGAATLRARDPSAIVLHSSTPPRVAQDGTLAAFTGFDVERRVAAMRFVRERFRVDRTFAYAPSYFYVVLVRRDRPR